MIFDLYTMLQLEAVPQRTVLTRAMSRIYGMDNPIGDPFGGPVYGEFNSPVVKAVEDAGRWIDREVLQPVYREVIQPVGKALEKIGQGIAKDPLTFIANAAAVALAPATGGMSLWALPVIAAASTAAKGGSMTDILTATVVAAGTAAIGGGFGMENSIGGLISSGLQTGGSVAAGTATYGIMGTSISATTAQAIATAGTGFAMAGVQGVGAAIQGKDPLMAALPSLVGSALGFAGNMAGQAEFFAPISNALKDISTNVSPIVSKAMTGVASAMITGAITGKDMSQVALASVANTVVSGLVSASNVVAEFFEKNDGTISNLGAATQSVVADLVGSVAATLASGGKLGTEMGAQFLANTLKTVLPFVTDPKFDAMATNVAATYKSAESKAKALNDAANAQQGLVDKYNGDVKTLNDLADSINADIAKRDAAVDAYNKATTQADIDKYRAEFNKYESSIAANTNKYNAIYDTIDDTNAAYLESVKVTEAAQKEYFDISKSLGSVGDKLSSKMNEVTKELLTTTAKQIDPNFNAEEYKQLNNLGPNIDAATHFLSAGKDQGLFTNIASAEAQRETLIDKATATLFRGQGWGSITEVPESVYTAARDRIANFYGNNLQGLTNFTVADMVAQSKMPATWYAPMWDENTRTITDAKVLFNNDPTAKEGQVVIADTVLPKGMSVASFYDIQSGNANVTRGNDGNFYWTTNTGTSAKIYDPKTGEVVTTTYSTYFADKELPSGAFDVSKDEYGRVVGYRTKLPDGTTSYHATISGVSNPQAEYANVDSYIDKDGTIVVKATRVGTALDDVDPFLQMSTYANVDSGIAANFNIQGIVQASKEVVDYFQKGATEREKLNIATIVKSGGSVLQDFGTVIKDLSVTIGLSKAGESNVLSTLGKQLENLAEAKTPEQYKAAMKDIEAMRKAAQGTDIVGVNAAIAAKYPDLVGISVFGGELYEEFFQSGIGKAAAAGTGLLAATLGAPALVAGAIGAGVGYGVSMAADFAESYRGAKQDMAQRVFEIYKEKGYSDAQAREMSEGVGAKAGFINGVITMFVNGATPFDLNKVLYGGKANPAQEAVLGYFTDKIATAIKVGVAEGVSGGIEGALQGAYNETLIYSIDPSKAEYKKGMADAIMLEAIISPGVASTTYVADNSFEMAQKTFTLANEKFTTALESGNIYTVGELGSVFKTWGVPTAISVDIVPDIIKENPKLLDAYPTPAELSTALKSSFGFDDVQAATITNDKYPGRTTTFQEAKDALIKAGLTNITDKDVLASGLVGTAAKDVKAEVYAPTVTQAATDFANKNMVTLAELQAAAQQEGYTATSDELNKLVGRGVQADVIAKFIQEIDPKAVTTAEATQYFKDLGYTKATAADIAQFVKSAPESEITKAVAAWVDPRQVTRAEAINYFAEIGYVPTEAEIAKYVVQGPKVVQDDIKKQLAEYVDPRFVDANEVQNIFKSMGLNAPVSASDLARLGGQYAESELAGKAKEALPIVSANSVYALLAGDAGINQQVKDEILARIEQYKTLGLEQAEAQAAATQAVAAQLGTTRTDLLTALGATENNLLTKLNNVETTLSDKITQYRNEGMTQAQAQAKALAEVSAQLGTTKETLLSQIGATETNLQQKLDELKVSTQTDIGNAKSEILTQMAAYEKAGIDRDTALDLAISGVAQNLNTTKADLLTKIGATTDELKTEFTAQTTAISKEVQDVADLVGKPANQVTQADIDAVNAMLSGQATTNLAYDTNNDGKIDQTDVTNIQNQLAFDQNQNIQTQVDPNTGLTIYVDTTTGKQVEKPTITGEQWTPTGIYSILEGQKKQAAATAKAQAASSKEAQRKNQFTQMMTMILGAPDAGGRKVEVSTPAPKPINYIYDFSSIFATPQQASMFPSPYGPVNTYGAPPQQQQGIMGGLGGLYGQAANNPMYKQASGFAEGGMINNDISVGSGGNIDDLLNILKGNG